MPFGHNPLHHCPLVSALPFFDPLFDGSAVKVILVEDFPHTFHPLRFEFSSPGLPIPSDYLFPALYWLIAPPPPNHLPRPSLPLTQHTVTIQIYLHNSRLITEFEEGGADGEIEFGAADHIVGVGV